MEIKSVIIDDEELAQQTLQLMLNEFAPEVTISGFANSAVNGILAIKEIQPDLIFLDVEINGLSGLEVLDTLETRPKTIVVTGEKKYLREASNLNVDAFITKPIESFDMFQNTVRKVMNIN